MTERSALLRINISVLEDLHLLFANPPGKILSNGLPDLGLNCYAKAYITTFLARLQGIELDFITGRALYVPSTTEPFPFLIDPHAWAGTRDGLVVDLSIHQLNGWSRVAAGCYAAAGTSNPVVLFTARPDQFDELLKGCPRLPPGLHVFYHGRVLEKFSFETLHRIGQTINSPHGRRIAARHPGNNVFAKAILHLHGLVTGTREPLAGDRTQEEAWDRLAEWDVDAVSELASLLGVAARSPLARIKGLESVGSPVSCDMA
jgi:hypothetical protein